MLRYMLDTNICIYVIKNKPPELKRQFIRHNDQLCISAITLSELYYGAEKSARKEQNLEVIETLTARLEVLPYADRASMHYGDIRAELELAGKPIGPYDLMIAAHARSEGLIVVTNNEREFNRVAGLRIENWINK